MKNYSKQFSVYLDELSAKQTAPGGGSAGALCFCLGLALAEKAIQYSIVKKAPQAASEKRKRETLKAAFKTLQGLRKQNFPVIDKDAALFSSIMIACGQKRACLVEQNCVLLEGLAESSLKARSILKKLESIIKKCILSDLYIAQAFVFVSFSSCIENLKANKEFFGKSSSKLARYKRILATWQP